MADAPAVSRGRKIRPFRAVRNPWALHSRVVDHRAQLCPWAFNPRGPRARNLPRAGYWHLALIRIVLIPFNLHCRLGSLDSFNEGRNLLREPGRPSSCLRRRQPRAASQAQREHPKTRFGGRESPIRWLEEEEDEDEELGLSGGRTPDNARP